MIRLLLIGTGAVVEQHYGPALQRLERAGAIQILGLADPNEERARRIGRRFRRAQIFPSCEAAFRKTTYDLSLIASPPGLHVLHACTAFAHGCHVLCEKPMATSMRDARRMNEEATKSQRMLGVAFPRRFHAGFADVAKLIAGGALGDDIRFVYREGSPYNWNVSNGTFFQRRNSGGGALIDRGVHMLDQLNWLFGSPIVVERSFDDSLKGGVETTARLELAHPRARGIMQVSWDYPLKHGLHIRGTRGEVKLVGEDLLGYKHQTDDGWIRIRAQTDWPADLEEKGNKRIRPVDGNACFEAEIVAMLRSITYGEPFPVTGIGAEAVQKAISDAYNIMESLECPWLSHAEQTAARAMHWAAIGSR
jgi:predicted dehydrogenase